MNPRWSPCQTVRRCSLYSASTTATWPTCGSRRPATKAASASSETTVWSVFPQLRVLMSGALVLTAGRPSIGLWLADGRSCAVEEGRDRRYSAGSFTTLLNSTLT